MSPGSLLRRAALATACMALCACAKLPEPESTGAQLYVARCATCHRAYQPSAMTFEMWKLVTNRMQGVISRNGLPPLTPAEMNLLLDYLKRNSA